MVVTHICIRICSVSDSVSNMLQKNRIRHGVVNTWAICRIVLRSSTSGSKMRASTQTLPCATTYRDSHMNSSSLTVRPDSGIVTTNTRSVAPVSNKLSKPHTIDSYTWPPSNSASPLKIAPILRAAPKMARGGKATRATLIAHARRSATTLGSARPTTTEPIAGASSALLKCAACGTTRFLCQALLNTHVTTPVAMPTWSICARGSPLMATRLKRSDRTPTAHSVVRVMKVEPMSGLLTRVSAKTIIVATKTVRILKRRRAFGGARF
mmetsp:Transcript_24717/g.57102  ORF Transcript_24717/g.57102 Transcript_24717/m.57102 type:complete len:267 (-) Transcript_24717:493-1293(-)